MLEILEAILRLETYGSVTLTVVAEVMFAIPEDLHRTDLLTLGFLLTLRSVVFAVL